MLVSKRTTGFALGLFALLGGVASSAKAQVGFAPGIGQIPTGQTMTVTPAVTADRRYVRLTVNAFFNSLNGISTFNFPAGAVSGGGGIGGGGGFGAGGGFGGGGIGGGGGLGGGGNLGGVGAVVGMTAGMDGIIGGESYDTGVQVGMQANAPQPSGMRAGPFPGNGIAGGGFGVGVGDPMAFDGGLNPGNGVGMMPGFEGDQAALMLRMAENRSEQGIRPAVRNRARSPRRTVRKSTKKPTSARRPGSARRTSR